MDPENIPTVSLQLDDSKDQNHDENTADDNKVEDEKPTQVAFKKPSLMIGPRRGKITGVRTLSSVKKVSSPDDDSSSPIENATESPVVEKSDNEQCQVSTDKKNVPLPYKEPSWGGEPPEKYQVEILKSGVILDTIDLSSQSFYVIGRLPVCDIPLAHPTISRYHAILQYRLVGDEKNGPGYYLYDLESTHGTFWNGCRVKPRTYVKLKYGHMIKFGCSQRKFIMQTPPDQIEEESEYTVTQLKDIRQMQLLERENNEKISNVNAELLKIQKRDEESEGINWGMAEDAEEESELAENPFALTNNEELFLDDPKKTLRGWFEREGHDLQYQTEEKGIGQFLCWVNLPIDSTARSVRAEALVKGKKKEAVIQCALEACRILDRHGVLRQATHEGRKRKSRNWEEEDFYDSDEDNFLDRTGTVERKREQRMRNAGKLETKVETYSSLVEKLSNINKEIMKYDDILKKHQESLNAMDENSEEDALNAFMTNLSSSLLNKSEISKMKFKLQNLRKEKESLIKIVEIAKPASLPELNTTPDVVDKSKIKTDMSQKRQRIDDDDNTNVKVQEPRRRYGLITNPNEFTRVTNVDDEQCHDELTETTVNDEHEKQETEIDENIDDAKITEAQLQKKKKKNQKKSQQRAEKAEKAGHKNFQDDIYKEDGSDWLPPQNQSGDGKTSLNEKFGY